MTQDPSDERRAGDRHEGSHWWALPVNMMADALFRLTRQWGSPPKDVTVRSEHHERVVFDTLGPEGPVIVKVDSSSRRHSTETAVLTAAASALLPVPRVLYADPRPPAILVLTRLAGRSLGGARRGAWHDAGRVLRSLHELPPPGRLAGISDRRGWAEHFAWWSAEECRFLLRDEGLAAAQVREMRAQLAVAFAAMEEPVLCLIHGDCQPDHYLVQPGGDRVGGIIDFGDVVLGDPVYDFAVLTIAHSSHLGELLDGYGAGPELRRRADQFLRPYQLIRRLGSARWMREHGYDDAADLGAATALLG